MTLNHPSSGLVSLKLRPSELAGVIEALHDGVLRRLRWSTVDAPEFQTWRKQNIELVQIVLDTMIAAYTKAVMTFREEREKEQGFATEFEDEFSFPDEVWDLLTAITTATSWDEVPIHPIHMPKEKCTICGTISGVA
jgi:hypothetical protein